MTRARTVVFVATDPTIFPVPEGSDKGGRIPGITDVGCNPGMDSSSVTGRVIFARVCESSNAVESRYNLLIFVSSDIDVIVLRIESLLNNIKQI